MPVAANAERVLSTRAVKFLARARAARQTRGLVFTKGARAAIEAAGGKVED